MLTPDEAVREAITTVLTRFDELGSARQAVLSLRADGLRLPRRSAGSRVIRWAEATYPAVHDFITNPTYGGTFVFGRRKVVRHVDESGRIDAGMLTLAEIAEHLDIAPHTVKSWRRSGIIMDYPSNDKGECLYPVPTGEIDRPTIGRPPKPRPPHQN